MYIRANFVDILSRRIDPVEVVVEEGKIVSITPTTEVCSTYILPGFIDAHIHIESSMLIPTEFARLAVLHGSVATVSDPHEIANVLGIRGVEFMLTNGDQSDFKFYFGASPCVPATPFETSGATLDAKSIDVLLQNPKIKFLSEVMNFPGVIGGDEELMKKIAAAHALKKPVDGHAPGLRGEALTRYIAAGITTDHEAFSYEEGREKLQKGMKILIREGSAAKNFEALHPLIDEFYEQLMFCSDDRHPNDLLRGHINTLVCRALKMGHDLFRVLQIACINPINHYGLDVGMLRIGDSADFIEVVDLVDLVDFKILKTVIGGKIVAENGVVLLPSVEVEPLNQFHAHSKTATDFAVACCEKTEVIVALDHELITHEMKEHLVCHEGDEIGDSARDILKIAVINRYADYSPSVAFVHGFGLKKGAIASSIAHDSHNIIAVGCSDEEIAEAVNLVIASRGGISAVGGGLDEVIALDIGGIMSSHDAFGVADSYERLSNLVKEELGSTLSEPYMTLSFMALLVIPELKLSDKGLFDANNFRFIPTCV